MINDKDIQSIADFLTEDPDIFQEGKRKELDKVQHDEEFDVESEGHKQQKEPRKPGQQTHKTRMQDVGKDHPGTKGS